MDSKKTGAFICELRKNLGLTQIALAEKLNVSNRAVSKWENGDGFPDVTTMPLLAETLGVTVDELLAGEKTVKCEPKILFSFEGKSRVEDLSEGYKAFINSKLHKPLFVAVLMLIISCSVTFFLLDLPNKKLYLLIMAIYFVFVLVVKFLLPNIGSKILIQDEKIIHSSNQNIKIEFGDKIYATTDSVNQEIEYNGVSKMIETKNLIVIVFGRGRFLAVNKNEHIDGNLDEFREFIKGKVVPNKKETLFKKINTVLAVLLIAMSIAVIPLDFVLYKAQSQQYKPSFIETRVALFNDSRKEFDRALKQIQGSEEIKKDVEEDGYYCYSADSYIALNDVLDVEVGEEYITFSTYDNNDCFSGFAYVEGDSIPYPYQIGFEHADIENDSFNYVPDDDLYLLGKDKNDKSNAKDWYLIKILDDNWYYYQYY